VARHNPGESMDELFKRVDDALYRAKSDGRNKVLAA
jgi:PleD family two-component response regulator